MRAVGIAKDCSVTNSKPYSYSAHVTVAMTKLALPQDTHVSTTTGMLLLLYHARKYQISYSHLL